MPKLSLVTDPEELAYEEQDALIDSQQPLREQISQIVSCHREQVLDAVGRWIVYWVQMGARELPLDECPSVAPEDRDFVIDWLRQEGFTVHQPRLWGRVIISVQIERRLKVTPDYQPERRQSRRRDLEPSVERRRPEPSGVERRRPEPSGVERRRSEPSGVERRRSESKQVSRRHERKPVKQTFSGIKRRRRGW